MKAVILAAGLGTRLRPITNHIPKVMVEIGTKPLLQYHIEWLAKNGITEIGINLYYLPQIIVDHFGNGSRFGVNIHYIHQDTLSETATNFLRFQNFIGNEQSIVIYGDNLFQLDIDDLKKSHDNSAGIATIVTRYWDDPSTKGVVEIDKNNKILSFKEKPKQGETSSKIGNAGIYILESEVLEYINKDTDVDFGKHLFPELLLRNQSIYSYKLNGYHTDIGTPEALDEARRNYSKYENLA